MQSPPVSPGTPRPKSTVGIGIDFGTSNTAAALYDGQQVTLIQLETRSVIMPSAIYFDRDHSVTTGEQAIADYISANQGRKVELSAEVLGESRTSTGQIDAETNLPGESPTGLVYGQAHNDAGMPGRLFRGVKRLLGNKDIERITIFDRPFRLVALITPLLLRVRESIQALIRKQGIADAARISSSATIGHPVNFEGSASDHNQIALNRLLESYGHAGIKQGFSYPEPNAAALSFLAVKPHLNPDCILTVDFGGGTLDFCVLRRVVDRYEVLGIHGIGLGGDHIDQRMYRRFVFPLLGKGERWRREIEGKVIETLFPFEGMEEYLLNWTISYMLNQNTWLTPVIDMKRQGGQAGIKFDRLYELVTQNYSYQVFQALKLCKEALSDRDEVLLDIPEVDIRLPITRHEFEAVIHDLLLDFETAVSRSIEVAGISAQQVDLVLRTGGSCLIPAVSQALEVRFPGKVVEHDPFTSVAAGLAIADYRRRMGLQ